MCSVCGIIDSVDARNADLVTVMKMGREMKHRGPDDSKSFTAQGAALHHNRLAVIDVENGIQPMTAHFGGRSYTIVYNGEIYNTAELREKLLSQGVHLRTRCDTEIVLYSYILFGEKCVELLNGIFAFCVYDHVKKRAFLARDRFGIKPLFYSIRGSTLIFASEIKAMLAHPKIEPVIDKTGLWQLLYMTPVTINGSGIFKDIYELKPGEYGVYYDGKFSISRYWSLCAEECADSSAVAAEKVRALLDDAVTRQLGSDVPLCTFLSGGLDSSVITAIAKKSKPDLATYSFEYEGNRENFHSTLFQPQGDDKFAGRLADWLGTDHTVLTAPTKEVADCLFSATAARDLPGQADIDSSLLYFCRRVRERHTVAMSGECADEIFGGYPWFYRAEMLYRDFFPWIHDPFVRIGLFDEAVARKDEGFDYMRTVYRDSVSSCPMLANDSDTMKTARLATWLSVNYFMVSLLERKDRMSMASGLEVRVPFADHRILEYVYNVPWEIKFENGVEKSLLRNAAGDLLPDFILHRKKSPYPKTHNPGYLTLVSDMLRERLASPSSLLSKILKRDLLDDLIRGSNATWFGQLMGTPQLIAWLIQLDYWFEHYNVRIE